ncbi:phosphate ABC transporter permease PstA [Simiduia aestuariiviva]|uniref:Phosphate transport system permease protein PstA n=1 Tax=Simiduia aestuariiviva TaxID=1510459 RepID=A0A839UTS6_9GAMM|nr:phosphate ABC transporter permease PstA [Simiduia aestuariiviva]MBB3169850.1 phosphate transport system permease protein [Simiduia aestuariiviva]
MTSAESTIEKVNKNLARRYRAEQRFRLYGILSVLFGLSCLVVLFTDIIGKGYKGFVSTEIYLTVDLSSDDLGISDPEVENAFMQADFEGAIKRALYARLDVTDRRAKRALNALISSGASYALRDQVKRQPELLDSSHGFWLLADDDVDTWYKSVDSKSPFTGRLSDEQLTWLQTLDFSGELRTALNTTFFTSGDSREPEMAGIMGAALGSFFTVLVTLLLSFPIGVAAAVYLEEYAPKNRWTDLIEVNINNLAAVPSIIFGLLGLAIFINFFEMPRSIPLVGGLVLTLMTLPTIIISSRAAIKAVPPSIREAALGLGASKMQMVMHHVLPLAMPGMLTGAIIGMAQALGETAPLLMIGMVAFVVDLPGGVMDAATALPVQIFLWADSPERAFVEKTSAAIMVLLGFLFLMNALAVWLRRRLERRW